MTLRLIFYISFLCHASTCLNAQTSFLFSSDTLTETGDLSTKMVAGVDRFLTGETQRLSKQRDLLWKRDFSSEIAFRKSISTQKNLLAHISGVADQRLSPHMEAVTDPETLTPFVKKLNGCTVTAVRWSVLEGLNAEGLLLKPNGKARAVVVMLPDADMQPEILAGLQDPANNGFGAARQLAETGMEVLIPVLVNRDDSFSGNTSLNLFTNQPHREWIYRQGYEVGRHIIGYELQKIFSAIDWLQLTQPRLPVGVAGYGEGGLLAMCAAALDERIATTLISGYFNEREQLWQEPIYRNMWGLLKNFGDAELTVMSWPRTVIIEHSKTPVIHGPAAETDERSGAAPGQISTPLLQTAQAEWNRAKAMVPQQHNHLQWIASVTGKPFSYTAIQSFLKSLKVEMPGLKTLSPEPVTKSKWVDTMQRQKRAVKEMETHVQKVLQLCHYTREKNFWSLLKGDAIQQQAVKASLREALGETLGQLPTPDVPANTKARKIKETNKWSAYEMTFDVFPPDVFAWGILIIPKDMKPGEKKPVVVCQHGLEGLPIDVMTDDTSTQAYKYYKNFAVQLAERGYVTFIPHNLYRGGDAFRVLQRKANPIGLTLFSVITSQHRRIVEWLGQQSFVDASRIGFYGLSYGGKTAMRVPALVEGYALSICSADFNEWVYKVSTANDGFGYLYTGEYDMPEWDLGHTFNYAEMAALIAPRPFMVERGHHDVVGVDEWIDFEYAKVRRHYVLSGIPQNTAIEHFNGPHTINAVGTFEFLDKFLKK